MLARVDYYQRRKWCTRNPEPLTLGFSWSSAHIQWYGGHCTSLISCWIQGFSKLVTHPVTNAVQLGLTSMKSKELVVLFRANPTPFVHEFSVLPSHCYDSDWRISGYINTHNHFKIANRKRKRKKNRWLTFPFVFNNVPHVQVDADISSHSRRACLSNVWFWHLELSASKTKKNKAKQKQNRTQVSSIQMCFMCLARGPKKRE